MFFDCNPLKSLATFTGSKVKKKKFINLKK